MNYVEHYKNRNYLIDKLDKSEITKDEFIYENMKLYPKKPSMIVPPVFESLEEGLYFYQFYNTMAKFHQKQAFELYLNDKISSLTNRYKSDEYYECKELSTFRIFNYVERNKITNIRAYYVSMKSDKLNGLIEIIFDDFEKVILHSLSLKVLRYIKRLGFFCDKKQVSSIDNYINREYY